MRRRFAATVLVTGLALPSSSSGQEPAGQAAVAPSSAPTARSGVGADIGWASLGYWSGALAVGAVGAGVGALIGSTCGNPGGFGACGPGVDAAILGLARSELTVNPRRPGAGSPQNSLTCSSPDERILRI